MSVDLPLNSFSLLNTPLMHLDGRSLSFHGEGFTYPFRLRVHAGADKLFIMLNGAVDQEKTPLPVFARWNWGKILNGHILSVCDPTLYMDKALRIGWFLGNVEKHAIPGLELLSKIISDVLGVDHSNRIFYGSSGGGFAAIQAATNTDSGGKAIAINPQTNILCYHDNLVSHLKRIFFGLEEVDHLVDIYPDRWNIITSIHNSRRRGKSPRIIIAQNTIDQFHYKNHYLPFASSMGIQDASCVDSLGNIMSMIYTSPEGHGAEPPELVKRICDQGIPFLFSEL